MRIREATLDDVPRLVRLGRLLSDESPVYRGLEYDPERAAVTLERAIPGGGVFVAEVPRDTVIGYLVAERVPMPAHRGSIVVEESLFVLPERRGGTAAPRLIRAMEAWGWGHEDVVRQAAGVSTGVTPERTARLYQVLGWSWAEIGMVKNRPGSA